MRRNHHTRTSAISTAQDLLQAIRAVPVSSKGLKAALEPEIIFRKAFFSCDQTGRFNITNRLATVPNDVARLLLMNILRNDPSPLVRHEAAFALGCVGTRDCVIALLDALREDKSFLVRHEAAMALSELGGQAEIPALRRGVRDKSKEVAVSCRVAMQRIEERTRTQRPWSTFKVGVR